MKEDCKWLVRIFEWEKSEIDNFTLGWCSMRVTRAGIYQNPPSKGWWEPIFFKKNGFGLKLLKISLGLS